MGMFMVTPPGVVKPTALARLDDEVRTHRWSHGAGLIGRWVRDDALYDDYFFDHWATWRQVSEAEAQALIDEWAENDRRFVEDLDARRRASARGETPRPRKGSGKASRSDES